MTLFKRSFTRFKHRQGTRQRPAANHNIGCLRNLTKCDYMFAPKLLNLIMHPCAYMQNVKRSGHFPLFLKRYLLIPAQAITKRKYAIVAENARPGEIDSQHGIGGGKMPCTCPAVRVSECEFLPCECKCVCVKKKGNEMKEKRKYILENYMKNKPRKHLYQYIHA